MQYSELESWQVEEIAGKVHEMVGYFNHLKKRMDQTAFPHDDRLRKLVDAAFDEVHTLWVDLHYANVDQARRERKKRPR